MRSNDLIPEDEMLLAERIAREEDSRRQFERHIQNALSLFQEKVPEIIEARRAAWRESYWRNREARLEQARRRSKTDRGREENREAQKRWYWAHRDEALRRKMLFRIENGPRKRKLAMTNTDWGLIEAEGSR